MKTSKKRLNLYLDEEFHQQLNEMAEANFMKQSTYVRVVLKKHFNADNKTMLNLLNDGKV